MQNPTCPVCSKEVIRRGNSGPMPTYCSPACGSKASYLRVTAPRKKRDRVAARAFRYCAAPGCGVALNEGQNAKSHKWCADHKNLNRSPDSLTALCGKPGCDRPRRARGVCSMHYKRLLRAGGKLKEEWNDRRRSNDHARRARKKGNTVTSAALLGDIIERDGLLCGACGVSVDLALAWPDPFSKSVDHIVPLARGGAHSLENCQLMHLRCNISKGARVAA